METLADIVHQEWIEERFNRKLIDKQIKAHFDTDEEIQRKIKQGIELVNEFINGSYYESKNKRIAHLKSLDIEKLVINIFVGITYCMTPEPFTTISAMIAGRLGFSDKKEAIQTCAELLAVLCNTDAFDICKEDGKSRITVVCRIALPDELMKFIFQSMYLPPMVCEPLELKSNYDSGYLTHRDSLILNTGNHHDDDICLDVLNTMNRVQLKLDMDFLCKVNEDPTVEFTVDSVLNKAVEAGKPITEAQARVRLRQQIEHWSKYKGLSQEIYLMLHRMGNCFYLTHKVDKRGRIYSQGYHINTQGSPYKKAQVELYKEELVEGVE